jgi:hypothetical protein
MRYLLWHQMRCLWMLVSGLKNRRPDRWRDVQQLQGEVGHYLLSDHPLTEQEWIKQRASIGAKDVTPALPDDLSTADKSSSACGLEDTNT